MMTTISNVAQKQEYSRIDGFLDAAAHKGGALTGLAVLIAALVLSFNTLMETAQHYGYGPVMAILWPLLVDGIILSQSLVVLRRSRLGFDTRFNWLLLITFEAASLFINGAAGWVLGVTVAEMITGALVHGLPPLALFLISKSMANDIKDNAKYLGVVQNLDTLQEQAHHLDTHLKQQAALQTERQQTLETLEAKQTALTAEIKQLLTARRQAKQAANAGAASPVTGVSIAVPNEAKQQQIEERRSQVLQLRQSGLKNAEIARRLQVSPDTIGRDMKVLNGQLQAVES
ncbi:MAG: DUF2637 domain-containing protein [Chloroflexota bacterium]